MPGDISLAHTASRSPVSPDSDASSPAVAWSFSASAPMRYCPARSESRKSNTANAVCLSAMCNLQRNDDGANNVRVDDASGRGPLRGAPSTGPIGSTVPRVHGSTVPRVHGFRAWKRPFAGGEAGEGPGGSHAVRGTGFGKLYAPFRHVKSMEGVPAVIGRRGRNASGSLARVHGRVAAGTLCAVAPCGTRAGSRPRAAPPERRRARPSTATPVEANGLAR